MIIYTKYSKNSKLSSNKEKVDCTYAPIEETCPDSCTMKKDKTCYASLGFVGIHEKRTSKESKKMSAIDLAKEEANLIVDNINSKSKFLRLHISGDSITKTGTKILAKASNKWIGNSDRKVWTYTHAWKKIPRDYWGEVSVLASVESNEQAKEAFQLRYVPAIIVDKFESSKAFKMNGMKFIPCPAQTHDNVSCASCKLCLNSDKLFVLNTGIAFEAHGATKEKIKRKLNVLNGNNLQ